MRFLTTTFLLMAALSISAATGDTTVVHSHVNTNLTWAGANPTQDYFMWTTFPNDGRTWSKIIMKFTLGCGSPQCSGWDYTVNTFLGKKTGATDTSIASIDSVFAYADTAWHYFQDSVYVSNNGTDTTWSYTPDSAMVSVDSVYTITDTVWAYAPHVNYSQIGRFITPYGTYMASNSNGWNGSWKFPYYYDITDYAELMKDSVNVKIHYSGYTAAFSGTVDFLLIEGEPSRTVLQVDEIYNQYIEYTNSAAFEAVASPKTVAVPAGMTSAKLNLIMTGHGGQGEFDPHNFQVNVNGNTHFDQLLWKSDCGMNAIASQGGTWVYNRANWCPGEKVQTFEFDLSPYLTAGQNGTIDLNLDDFNQTDGAGYDVAAYLVSYGSQPANDAAVEEIVAPNNDPRFVRYNPIATNPVVRIKNYGKNALSQVDIAYWVKGGNKCYYQWHGYLTSFQTADVKLPAFDWTGLDSTDRIFYAELSYPNNTSDDVATNNLLSSNFNLTPVLDSSFVIYLKTNNAASQDSFVLRAENGNILLTGSNFANSTIYRDTTLLADGSYSFDLYDYNPDLEGGDGISWWANSGQNGSTTLGQFYIQKLNGTKYVINSNHYGTGSTANGDFGNNIHYEFTVGAPLGFGDPKTPCTPIDHTSGIKEIEQMNLAVYPNPANENFFVKADRSVGSSTATIFNLQGQKVYEQSIYLVNGQSAEISLPASVSTGMYVVEIRNGKTAFNRKLSVIRE